MRPVMWPGCLCVLPSREARPGLEKEIGSPPRDGLPSTFSIETWDSVELKVNMLTKGSNGYTSKLVNLRRADPDPALFRPPADYTVVDQ